MLCTCPGEAAGVVTAHHVQRGVVQAGAGGVEHAHQQGAVGLGPRPTRLLLGDVEQDDGRGIRPSTNGLHERGAALRISTTKEGGGKVLFDDTLNTFLGVERSSKVERSLMVRWVVGSILHGVDPLSCFSFQPVLHDWCNKGWGMCYPVCGMVHIKEPLLLIDKSSLCGGSGFPFSLSEWFLTMSDAI